MNELDVLDALNDAAADCGTRGEAEQAVRAYCETHDLDPAGYSVADCGGCYAVDFAE